MHQIWTKDNGFGITYDVVRLAVTEEVIVAVTEAVTVTETLNHLSISISKSTKTENSLVSSGDAIGRC